MNTQRRQALFIVCMGCLILIPKLLALFGPEGTLRPLQWVLLGIGTLFVGIGLYRFIRNS